MSAPNARRADCHRTLILTEVLSNGPFNFEGDYDALHSAITDGDCSGRTLSSVTVPVTDDEAALLLSAQGSDPDFLLGTIDTDQDDSEETAASAEALDEHPNEAIVQIANGAQIRMPAHPEECSYVRVIAPDGLQIGYWVSDEWSESPEEVMGAIFGAAISLVSAVPGTPSGHTR